MGEEVNPRRLQTGTEEAKGLRVFDCKDFIGLKLADMRGAQLLLLLWYCRIRKTDCRDVELCTADRHAILSNSLCDELAPAIMRSSPNVHNEAL
jgi:hypothetical protein